MPRNRADNQTGDKTCALKLLGAFALDLDGQPAKISSRKGQILLARLATERTKRMSRQQMAAFLWPDRAAAQARASLRQALSRLRDAMGGAAALLQSDSANVWLFEGFAQIDTDHLSAETPISTLCACGEFLEGLHVGEPGLQEWLETERRHQRERLLSALGASAETAERGDRIDDTICIGLHQVTLDPLNEVAHRRLMRAFSQSRRASRAIEQYQTLKTLLRAELDVAPEKETTELYLEIRSERTRTSAAETTPEDAASETQEAFPELRLVTVLCVKPGPNAGQTNDITSILERHGGARPEGSEGDNIFFFGLEHSGEDDALRALEAASQLLLALPDHAAGMDLGLVTRDGDGVRGGPVRQAQALSFVAVPGEVLVGRFLRNHSRNWASYAEEELRGQKIWRLLDVRRGPLRPRLPLVGRKIEMMQLSVLQDEAARGQGAVAILSGNAGLGKTRLTEELESRSKKAGAAVLRVEFSPVTSKKAPLGLQIARDLAALFPKNSVVKQEIAHRVPAAFADALWSAEEPDLSFPKFAGYEPDVLFRVATETICCLLDHLPAPGMTLILEDCHWASTEELDFLSTLIARIHARRILVLATERAMEEALRPLLQTKTMETPLQVMTLSSLRFSEARKLAQSVLGELDEEDAKIVEHAAGNPLFTIRLAEARDELGDTLPTSVIALVQQQLDRLGDNEARACRNAAILGHSFAKADAIAIFGAFIVSDLLASGFVHASGDRLAFAHALIHQAVYDATPLQQRRKIHAETADYYRPRDAYQWADHALAGSTSPQVTAACIAASGKAVAENRFSTAERFIAAGLGTECTGDDRADLLSSLADMRREQGRNEEAVALYSDARDVAESPGARLRILVALASILRYRGAKEEASKAFASARKLVGGAGIPDDRRCDFLLEEGNRAFVAGKSEIAFASHGEALELARRSGHALQVARALGGLGDAHYANFELTSARKLYRECVDYAEAQGLGMVANVHRHMVSYTSFFVDPGDETLALARNVIDRAEREGNTRNAYSAKVDLLNYLILDCDHDGFAAHLGAVEALANTVGENRFQSDIDWAKCIQALLRGDMATLRCITTDYVRETPSPYMWPCFAALHACSFRDPDVRRGWLDRGEALLERSTISHAMIFFHHFAAEAMRDMPERAIAYAEKLRLRSGSELSGFADLSIRTTRLRAQETPDAAEMAALRQDLENARFRSFWPQLFAAD